MMRHLKSIEILENKTNIINNKETSYKYRKLNNNIDKDKKNNKENKVSDVNSSKLIDFKPRNNHFYKHRKVINDKDINKEIITQKKTKKVKKRRKKVVKE